jgi:hypothetical protein
MSGQSTLFDSQKPEALAFVDEWNKLEHAKREGRTEACVEVIDIIKNSVGFWILCKINGRKQTITGAKDLTDAARRLFFQQYAIK